MVGLFAPALTNTEDYASKPLFLCVVISNYFKDQNLTGEELHNVQYVNKVVGAVRFRQVCLHCLCGSNPSLVACEK